MGAVVAIPAALYFFCQKAATRTKTQSRRTSEKVERFWLTRDREEFHDGSAIVGGIHCQTKERRDLLQKRRSPLRCATSIRRSRLSWPTVQRRNSLRASVSSGLVSR